LVTGKFFFILNKGFKITSNYKLINYKNMKLILAFIVVLGMGMAITSCGNSGTKKDKTEQQGKEYTSAYVCPMHCEGSGSAEPGKCPVCGMDYVVNEDHKEDGHGHDHDDHDGHNH
jgi:hypothetical protein